MQRSEWLESCRYEAKAKVIKAGCRFYVDLVALSEGSKLLECMS